MRLQYPIILVHGLSGFDRLDLAVRGHSLLHVDYFRSIAEHLEKTGAARALAPALPPHGSVARRAKRLAAFIEREVRAPRFHLVAHSMGGLDSRHYLTHLGGAERGALSLTTLGTPHLGSPLATLAVGTLFDPCSRLARKLHLQRAVSFILRKTAAHRDLRPAACTAFNAATPDAPGVAYFSWAGAPPERAIQWPLRPAWHVMLRSTGGQPNDGMVTVESAQWTGWRGTVPADHLSLVGWQLSRDARKCFSPKDFYLSLLDDLEQAEATAE